MLPGGAHRPFTSMSENNAITEGAASEEGVTATKKELLSDEAKFTLVVIGLQMLVIWGFMTVTNWELEDQQLADEYILEEGQELGYNWTERNMTVFETMTSTGTFSSAPMHEVMCSNGVEEGCDYMITAETAENQYKPTFVQNLFKGTVLFVQFVLFLPWTIVVLWIAGKVLFG